VWLLWNARASYISVFVSTLIIFGFHKNRFKLYLLVFLVSIVAFIMVIRIPLFQELLRLEAGLSHRDFLWEAALNIIKQNPFFGLGPDSYMDSKFFYMSSSLGKNTLGLSNVTAHNLFLFRCAELGIGAGVILIAYWFTITYYFFKHEPMVRNSDLYYIYLGCGVTYIGLIFKLFFESSGNIVPLIFVAVVFRISQLVKSQQEMNITKLDLNPKSSFDR